MIDRHRFYILAFAILFSISSSVMAQDTDGEQENEGDDSAQASGETDEGDETSEAGAQEDESASDEGDLEEELDEDGDDDEDEDEDEEVEPADPGDLELDYEALGEMNPEADLSSGGAIGKDDASAKAVSEDWTERNMELFELHGYFRVRPELYHKFYIRNDNSLYPLNVDRNAGCEDTDKCSTLAGANMRFRFAPTINISEEVRVHSQIDFLDNMMMGSSPLQYQNFGNGENTVATGSMMGYNQGNASPDFINVRRAWGEMESSLGHLRFGRMPSHWGTGMLYNSGDGLDSDFGDSVDRISFAFKLNGWLIMPAFDFPNEGLYLDSAAGRPFDVSQMDDAYRIVGVLAYQHEEEDQRAMLKRGDWLINTGLHFSYRAQAMSLEWMDSEDSDYIDNVDNQISSYKRDMWVITPDIWFQLLYKTFHFELELAFNIGEIGEPSISEADNQDPLNIFAWGAVVQADYGLLSDQLRIGLEVGIASGDKDVEGVSTPSSFDQANGDSDRYSVFAFNPAFNVDYILYQHILGSVAGTYYFKPWLRYDFLKAAMGKRFGVQFDVIFSRAFYTKSTISNSSGNLGIELDARVDFVTADNFHASLKYGVLFPLGGFKGDWTGLDNEGEEITYRDTDLSIPQTLQLLLGITF